MSHFIPSPNTFKNTFCVFIEKNKEEIEALQPDYESKSGSLYYYTSTGMYRYSNHWGRLANSKWRLLKNPDIMDSKYKLGFAHWNDFYPDNTWEELYYLVYDEKEKLVNYFHKNDLNYNDCFILRTSEKTMKRIKLIRNIINLSNWAKHFPDKKIDELRAIMIDQLINTNKPIDQIKRELLNF